jgi:hypothetical protein
MRALFGSTRDNRGDVSLLKSRIRAWLGVDAGHEACFVRCMCNDDTGLTILLVPFSFQLSCMGLMLLQCPPWV